MLFLFIRGIAASCAIYCTPIAPLPVGNQAGYVVYFGKCTAANTLILMALKIRAIGGREAGWRKNNNNKGQDAVDSIPMLTFHIRAPSSCWHHPFAETLNRETFLCQVNGKKSDFQRCFWNLVASVVGRYNCFLLFISSRLLTWQIDGEMGCHS